MEGLLAIFVIDAREERYVSIADVAGAFSKADMYDLVTIKLQGATVEAILKVNQKYSQYVTN